MANITKGNVRKNVKMSEEIKDIRSRIQQELFEVLTAEERKNFDLDTALKRINNALKPMIGA